MWLPEDFLASKTYVDSLRRSYFVIKEVEGGS